MANIEITPLNISGVKLPFDLLDNLLGQTIDYNNLVYPLDLATNPQYCHAVLFSVHDYEYPVVEGAYQQLSSVMNQGVSTAAQGVISALNSNPSLTGNQILNAAKGLPASVQQEVLGAFGATKEELGSINGNTNLLSGVGDGLNSIKNKAPGMIENFVSNYGPLAQPGSYKPKVNDNWLASISLYMPDTLMTEFSSNYSETSLMDTFKLAGYAANAAADVLKNKDALKANPSNIAQLPTIEDLKRGAVAQVGGALLGQGGTLALQNALKTVPNPQLQLLYQGTDLRQFTFEFTFTPASSKEAESVDEIIKTFTYYSLPDLTAGVGGQFLIPPQIFKIKFAFLGDNGVAGQISDVLKNTVGNLLGNQFTKIMTGSNPTSDIVNAKNAKIFTINDCVLKNVQVNYAPNGWASYQDGYPIQTTLSLTFGEINMVTKQSAGMSPKNSSIYNLTSVKQNALINQFNVSHPSSTYDWSNII